MNDAKTKKLKCDIAVIGGGAGGLSVAAGAAQLGVKVILVEADKMGGDCLNAGCVPSKSLLAAAKTHWQARNAQQLGLTAQNTLTDFKAVMNYVHQVIDNIAEHDSVARFESLGVQVILAPGKFINPTTIQAGEFQITAKRFVIATGSSPFIPPINGINDVPYLTNETIFNLNEQPQHLIVIGGGPIGVELAQAFIMLGSRVTLLEAYKILPKDEPDCAAIVKKQLQTMGVALQEEVKINQLAQRNNQIELTYEHDGKLFNINGTHLLIATGRRANLQKLALEKANIEYTPQGIKVDKRLRTTNRKIFAIGDAVGPFQFTHIAGYHASIVIKNILFRLPAKIDYKAVPWVTYTEPALAHVGLSTQDAEQQGIAYQLKEWSFAENDRAQAQGRTIGKIKVLTDKKARIYGVTIVGSHADELLLPWIMAIQQGKTLRSFTDLIVPYPTLSEINKKVASEFYAPILFSKKVQQLVKYLIKLG